MGQIALRPKSGRVEDAALALERLVPQDILAVAPGRQRYAQFTNGAGGILDDLMVAHFGSHLFLVVNAACKAEDEAHLRANLSESCVIDPLPDRALIALQGPKAEAVLAKLCADVALMRFMDAGPRSVDRLDCFVSRSGYTGEDGFEISVPPNTPSGLRRRCFGSSDASDRVGRAQPAARGRTLSLWPRHRCDDHAGRGRAGRPPSAAAPAPAASRRDQIPVLENGAARRRVGLRPEGRAPVREGAPLFPYAASSEQIGKVTSGGFGPSINAPVAMGYLPSSHAAIGGLVFAELRGQRLPLRVAATPFVPNTYKR
jgi:aminomethyltransferase